jgi:hypothetical protein
MARDRILVDEQLYEETIHLAERACADLEAHPSDAVARALAEGLRQAAQSLRLALVADADASILTRIQCRLEALMHQAPSVLASCEAKPASQRPTAPPPSSLDPVALFDEAPHSDRPTIRPGSHAPSPLRAPAARSGVVSKIDAGRLGKRNVG